MTEDMITIAQAEDALQKLINLPVIGIWSGGGTGFKLEIGENQGVKRKDDIRIIGDWSLSNHDNWKLKRNERLLFDSAELDTTAINTEQHINHLLHQLVDARIKSIDINQKITIATFVFSNGYALQLSKGKYGIFSIQYNHMPSLIIEGANSIYFDYNKF